MENSKYYELNRLFNSFTDDLFQLYTMSQLKLKEGLVLDLEINESFLYCEHIKLERFKDLTKLFGQNTFNITSEFWSVQNYQQHFYFSLFEKIVLFSGDELLLTFSQGNKNFKMIGNVLNNRIEFSNSMNKVDTMFNLFNKNKKVELKIQLSHFGEIRKCLNGFLDSFSQGYLKEESFLHIFLKQKINDFDYNDSVFRDNLDRLSIYPKSLYGLMNLCNIEKTGRIDICINNMEEDCYFEDRYKFFKKTFDSLKEGKFPI